MAATKERLQIKVIILIKKNYFPRATKNEEIERNAYPFHRISFSGAEKRKTA